MNRKIGTNKMITVIGGGPSGMMAAISAALSGEVAVRILEKNDLLGKKLLATGNGRCNLTNINCPDAAATLDFFSEIGLLTKSEGEGRVYPYSEQASAVQEVLVNMLRDLEVEILCGVDIQTIERNDSAFIVSGERKTFYTDAVILATGGKAGPQYGSTGEGYRIAKKFGHTVVRTMPSLVQMVSDMAFFRQLKGVRIKGVAELLRDDRTVDREAGEIQFTEDGLSGICIFNLSKDYQQGDTVRLDLFPDYDEALLLQIFKQRVEFLSSRMISEFFLGMINKKLIPVILGELSLDEKRTVGTLTEAELKSAVKLLKGWIISITGTKGWKEAQVTSGGISLSEVNLDTMESRIIPKLYFAGELLDWDGKCGGYNLQWAWSSGRIAGKAAAEHLAMQHVD